MLENLCNRLDDRRRHPSRRRRRLRARPARVASKKTKDKLVKAANAPPVFVEHELWRPRSAPGSAARCAPPTSPVCGRSTRRHPYGPSLGVDVRSQLPFAHSLDQASHSGSSRPVVLRLRRPRARAAEWRRPRPRALTTYDAEVTFGVHHQGGPGIAHGGIVGAALDEACGLLATWHRFPAVTARIAIRFRRPVPINRTLQIASRVTADRGRRIEIVGGATGRRGTARRGRQRLPARPARALSRHAGGPRRGRGVGGSGSRTPERVIERLRDARPSR